MSAFTPHLPRDVCAFMILLLLLQHYPCTWCMTWLTFSNPGFSVETQFQLARLETECLNSVCCMRQAVSMVGMIAYLSYLVAEHFGCSGIVAIFTCAVVMSHYALYNVPREIRKATRHTAEVFSYLCEGAIFLYVGLDTIDPVTWQVGVCVYVLSCSVLGCADKRFDTLVVMPLLLPSAYHKHMPRPLLPDLCS